MANAVKVVCRCGKVSRSMKDWNEHLKKKHPKWAKELALDGSLDDDRRVFREARQR